MSDNVEALLKEKDVTFRYAGKDLLVLCFNPEHDDSNPSTRIDRVTGVFHCFTCGYRGNIFDLFNKVRDHRSEKAFLIRRKIRDIITSTVGLELPEGLVPFHRDFRTISGNTYKHFEAFTHSDYEDRIVFPIKDISGRIVAFSARHILSDASPKYIIYPEEAKLPIYPANVRPYRGSIVLVEGLFDMLNLYDKGLTNVGCLFGTQAVSYNNIIEKLNPLILSGAKHVYLLMDGDPAGKKAAEELKKMITYKTNLVVEIISLAEGTDPGDLKEDVVALLKTKMYEKDN